MIPNSLAESLRSTARITFDEAKEAVKNGEDEFEVKRRQQQAVNKLSSDGSFEVLGFGAGRAAVTHPAFSEFAVKIARYTPRSKRNAKIHGVAQNQQEAWTWDNLPVELRSRLTAQAMLRVSNK